MSGNTRSKSATSRTEQNSERSESDCEPLLTRSMLQHISPDQKEKYAQMLKEDGNKLFKEKNFLDAIRFYSAAIGFKEDAVFYSNRSACYAGLKDYHKVIADTTAALNLKPDFMKCLVRRASAYERVDMLEESATDFLLIALYEKGDVQNSPAFSAFQTAVDAGMMKAVDDLENGRGLLLPSADYLHHFLGGFDKELTVEGLPEDPAKLKPDSGDFYLISGMKKIYTKSSNRYIEADELFTKALAAYEREFKADPTNAVLKRKLGVAHEYVFMFKTLKNDVTCIAHSKKCLELNPQRARALVFLSCASSEAGRLDQCEVLLKRALTLAPKSAEANFYMGRLFEKIYHATQKKADATKAYEFFKKAKQYRPDNVYTVISLMDLALTTNDLDGLKKLEVLAREKFGRSPEYANYSGEVLRDVDNWAGAMGQFQLAMVLGDIAPGASIRVQQIANAVQMLITNPDSKEADLDLTAATDMLEKGLKIDPRSDVIKLTMASLKKRQGKAEEAIALYKETAVLAPSFDTRKMIVGIAFTQGIELKLRKFPELLKRFESLKLDGVSPYLTNESQQLLSRAFASLPCTCAECVSGARR